MQQNPGLFRHALLVLPNVDIRALRPTHDRDPILGIPVLVVRRRMFNPTDHFFAPLHEFIIELGSRPAVRPMDSLLTLRPLNWNPPLRDIGTPEASHIGR